MSVKTEREIDLVVFGATGFTGDYVAEYISKHPHPPKKWAIAGRSEPKLRDIKKKYNLHDEVEIIIAESGNEQSLIDMAKRCKVVLTTVGPYTHYGTSLFKACAENGTHYVDLTGEGPWLQRMINTYNDVAQQTGAILVPSCGLDSVPSDLSAYEAVKKMREVSPSPTTPVGKVRSGWRVLSFFSGGTLASGIAMAEDLKQNGMPEGLPVPTNTIWCAKENGTWGSFWLMSPYNRTVVERTRQILDRVASNIAPYGRKFDYNEFTEERNPIVAFLKSAIIITSFILLNYVAPVRWLVKRFGPSQGSGPVKYKESGRCKVSTIATSEDGKYGGKCILTCKGDPAYYRTASLLAECAMLLIEPEKLTPIAAKGGVLTPASAFGDRLKERIDNEEVTGWKVTTEGYENGADKKKSSRL
ncbi:hypothetical protein BT69DRAFT_1261661 [Atractiella rhizophila]|nr:hypothetical protein BT69DRAFT_1261661 [Atractiella rhizophila]